MSYTISELNGIKIYNFTAGKTLPQFLKESKTSLKHNQDYRNRIELIQDFTFNTASKQVHISDDLNYIVATGIYPPSMKIFETKQFSMKCMRGMDSECIKFQLLCEDYSKIALACQDRNIEIHAQYGKHDKVRVPRVPLDMVYNKFTCDLILSSSQYEIYRLNLNEGRFLTSFQSSLKSANNLEYNEYLNILLAGGDEAQLEIWDYRQRSKIKQINTFDSDSIQSISKIASMNLGLIFAVGGSNGLVQLYDFRMMNQALLKKQHQYMLPINSIIFHNKTNNIISSDSQIIKIYNKIDGKIFTNYQPNVNINQIELVPNSGLILAACEHQRIGQYFIPQLDTAPKWCNYIENITEELEEKLTQTIYDEFKFVNYSDLEKLNAVELIGTKHIKQYMHGYLINYKLYQKLKAQSDPFEYEDYQKVKVQKKLEENRANRISLQKTKRIKVNQQLVEDLEKQKQKSQKKRIIAERVLADERFQQLYTDEQFQRDEASNNKKIKYDQILNNQNVKQNILKSYDERILKTKRKSK